MSNKLLKRKFLKSIFLIMLINAIFTGLLGCSILEKDELYKYQWALHGRSNFIVDSNVVLISHGTPVNIKNYDKEKMSLGANAIKENKDIHIGWEDFYKKFKNYKDKKDVVVAVIDSGVDISHEEIKDNIWVNTKEVPANGIDDDKNGYIDDVYGYNFCDNNGNVYTSKEHDIHGTHIAGTIVAKHDNGGIKGMAYDKENHIKIMSLKINGEKGQLSYMIDAIRYAEKMGADICNISQGVYIYDSSLDNVIKNSKMVFVVAAGNGISFEGFDIDEKEVFPACLEYDNVITVGNIAFDGNLYKSSNFGSKVDINAPGTWILSTIPEGQYGFCTGTSFSTSIVTAGVAMKLSMGVSQKEVKKEMLEENRSNNKNFILK